MIILQTPRLILREMDVSDAGNAFELNNDPEVVRYTGDSPFKSIEEAAAFLAAYNHYRLYGYGRWAVLSKETSEFLGWCGLKYILRQDETDIGFRFAKKHWNKGYATEAARACIEHGFTKFGLKEIVGRAMKENSASIRVLQKAGLVYLHDYSFAGEEAVLYQISNPAEK